MEKGTNVPTFPPLVPGVIRVLLHNVTTFNTCIQIDSTLLIGVSSIYVSEGLKVTLKHGGTLIGRHMESAHGRYVKAYLGVRYAKPPLGELRLRDPVPPDAWEGEKLAITEGNKCAQLDVFTGTLRSSGDEDCLFLNLFVPQYPKTKRPLPVMVWVPGGAFISGTGLLDDNNPKRLMDRDMIFVTFNYRVNALGFLSSETMDIPGNFGLKDQVMALKWVKEHISAFGGDENSITIVGESAGSTSVSYLTLSESTKGLFHRAIASSGTFYDSWASPAPKGAAARQARKIAESLGCGSEEVSWANTLSCLQTVPVANLVNATLQLYVWGNTPSPPLPIVIEPEYEGAFLTHPLRVTEYSNSLPMMMGYAKDDGLVFLVTHSTYLTDWELFLKQLDEFFPYAFNYQYIPKENEALVKQAIIDFYFENGTITKSQNLTDAFTDATFFSGFDDHVRHRLSKEYPAAPTYVFRFQHKGEVANSYTGVDEFLGVCHADDNFYLFPTGDSRTPTSVPSQRDRELSDNMIDMWYNFISMGDPCPANTYLPKWPAIDSYPPQFMGIGSLNDEDELVQLQTDYPESRAKFWRDIRPYLRPPDYQFL